MRHRGTRKPRQLKQFKELRCSIVHVNKETSKALVTATYTLYTHAQVSVLLSPLRYSFRKTHLRCSGMHNL